MIQTPRAPRFERIDLGLNTQITDRDREVLRFVAIHRFVRSTHIAEFIEGSHQQLLRRLQRLFHLGFLNRPRCQIEYYNEGGARELVYSLTSKGAREISTVASSQGINSPAPHVERFYLKHALMTTDIALAFERACRAPEHDHFQLIQEKEISDQASADSRTGDAFHWFVDITRHLRVGVRPDRVLQVGVRDSIFPESERATFFIEADRGTMPVSRTGLEQTSILRKLLAYQATWAQGLHRSLFNIPRFRVLIVASDEKRIKRMIEACQTLERGHRMFLFASHKSFLASENVFGLQLINGKGEPDSLLHSADLSGKTHPFQPLFSPNDK